MLIETRGDWYLIEDSSGRRGYMFKTVVRLGPEPVVAPVEAPAPPPPPQEVALDIDHKEVGCMVAEQYPKLDACLVPEGNVGRAYIHFRAQDSEPWYAVELTRDGPCYSTFLPKPMRGTREIQYYVDVLDRALTERQRPTDAPQGAYRAKVVGKEGDCGKLGKMAVRFAKAARPIVVSVARDAAGKVLDAAAAKLMENSVLLAGFRPEGVLIGSTGAAPGAASSASTGTTSGAAGGAAAGGGGIGIGTIAIVAGGVLAAGAVGLAAKGGGGGSGSSTPPPSTTQPPQPPTINGVYAFSLRCQGVTELASQANITLNQTSGGAFSGTAPGMDAGGAFTLQISGNYTASSGLLTGQLMAQSPQRTRIDTFSTTLRSNDTGFVPTTCIQDCGCPAEFRLNRLS